MTAANVLTVRRSIHQAGYFRLSLTPAITSAPGGNMAYKETPIQDAGLATGQFHFLTGFDANGDVQSETSGAVRSRF